MNGIQCFILLAHEGHSHAAEAVVEETTLPAEWFSLAILAAGVLAALVVILFVLSKLRGGKSKPADQAVSLRVDVQQLSDAPPSSSAARLEVYNVPMRLALLVIAPAGRDAQIPPSSSLPLVVDAIVPNLMQVLNDHQPDFRRWPPQLSSQGFSQVFFNNVPLPGDGGKNTRWCGLAGRFDTPGGPFLAGLVCVAETPNAIGQITINQPGQWLDLVRVKPAG